MRPTRGYSGQHVVQRVAHRSLLFRVERAHGAHQNFEWIARNRFLTLVRQSQTEASPVRLGSLSDQVPPRLKCLDRLRSGATGGRLKLRKCRRSPGEGVGAGPEPQRHPSGRAESAVVALGLHEPSHQQQEFRRFARRHDRLFEHIIVFRNYLDNRRLADNFVSKLVRLTMARITTVTILTAESGLTHYFEQIRRVPMLEPQDEYMFV